MGQMSEECYNLCWNWLRILILDTTRPKKPNEIDGVHYHFVSKQKFNEDAKAGKFIEYGEYQKYMYGTSMASIQVLIDKAKTCLLTLKAEVCFFTRLL